MHVNTPRLPEGSEKITWNKARVTLAAAAMQALICRPDCDDYYPGEEEQLAATVKLAARYADAAMLELGLSVA
jgi:hypothetical protein